MTLDAKRQELDDDADERALEDLADLDDEEDEEDDIGDE